MSTTRNAETNAARGSSTLRARTFDHILTLGCEVAILARYGWRALPLAATLVLQGALAADPSLTIYNQNFAVVRDTVALDLKAGLN